MPTHEKFIRCKECSEELHRNEEGDSLGHDPACPILVRARTPAVTFSVDRVSEGVVHYKIIIHQHNGSSEMRGQCLLGEDIQIMQSEL